MRRRLGDVLLSAARGPNHLVYSAVAFGEVLLTEVVGEVKDDGRLFEG